MDRKSNHPSRQLARQNYVSRDLRTRPLNFQGLRYTLLPSESATHSSSTLPNREVNLITNSYSLQTITNAPLIYEYKLSVTTSEGYKDIPARVLSRNFVSRSIRKLIINELVPNLIGQNLSGPTVVIESNMEAIFSLNLFNENLSHTPGQFMFENLLLQTDLLRSLQIDVSMSYSKSFRLSLNEESLVFLTSVLHHELLVNMLRYGSVYFKSHQDSRFLGREDRLDLISEHIMGLSLSGLRRSIKNQILVVINCPHSYITKSHRLIDLLATFITSQPVEGLRLNHAAKTAKELSLMPEIEATSGTEPWFKTFVSILEGFKCRADGPADHINLRFILTNEAASVLIMDSVTNLNVQEHYRRLGITLNYPNLPCLKSRSPQHPYYPLEMCTLLAGQKVPIFRLSTAARNQLAFLNKPKPDLSKHLSTQARNELANLTAAQFKSFAIHLSEKPVEAKGQSLPRPRLLYQGLEIEPQRDYWESGIFYQPMQLISNWCVVNTAIVDPRREEIFFMEFSHYCKRFGFELGRPYFVDKSKEYLLENSEGIDTLIHECQRITNGSLKFIMFVIDSSSTPLNRLIHLSFDERPNLTATCLRVESILNQRQQRSIFRTLVHKLNARLGGTNVTYSHNTMAKLSLEFGDLMVIGLDVTHPDNELIGVSIVGCAYTYNNDLFRHRSLVWPQTARTEIIGKVDLLLKRLVHEYYVENRERLPKQIIVYRDGVSHEEFEKVKAYEISKAQSVLDETSELAGQSRPNLSYIIAQKRHTMRFFQSKGGKNISNPPSGTLIEGDVVSQSGREFYLYSNTSPQATARPLHYHVLLNGLGIENLQKLTYFLCFNFGKCSGTLSMPSSLRYAHNAAYDARNRVIASREFSENRFYSSKFFC